MKYKITLDYTNVLTYETFEDFTAAIGLLFEGGCKPLKVEAVKEEKDENDNGVDGNNSSMV